MTKAAERLSNTVSISLSPFPYGYPPSEAGILVGASGVPTALPCLVHVKGKAPMSYRCPVKAQWFTPFATR